MEEWLRRVRRLAGEAVLEAVSGPRGRIVECEALERRGHRLLCRGAWWRPSGVLAYVTLVGEMGVPVHRGLVWLEAYSGGLAVDNADAALSEPGGRGRLLVHGYATLEELTGPGAGLRELGAVEEEAALCGSGGLEAAAQLMAAAGGAVVLRRAALPAPPGFAPEHGGWLRALGPGVLAARPLVVYVSPSWAPNTGYVTGMAVPPAAVFTLEPGPVLIDIGGGGECRWLVRL